VKKRIGLRAAIGLMLGPCSASALAEIIVLRSVGVSRARYPAGARLPDNATFVLRPGDVIAILTPRGTRVFRGRGTFVANRNDGGSRQSATQVRIGLGATRGPGEAGTMPGSVWHAAVYGGGAICFPAGQRPTLWRAVAQRAATLTIVGVGGRPTQVPWRAGEATLVWPSTLPVEPAATYGLQLPPAPEVRARLRPIANGAALGPEALAQALLAARCEDQLATFIALNLADAPAR
jgi:hypothetical protein